MADVSDQQSLMGGLFVHVFTYKASSQLRLTLLCFCTSRSPWFWADIGAQVPALGLTLHLMSSPQTLNPKPLTLNPKP